MIQFIRLALSENGEPSAKRVILFILLWAFLTVIFVNLFTAKILMAELREELFYALSGSLMTVFGSNVVDAWKQVKTVQSANNAKVGEPSPTQPPAPAAPVTNVIP